MTEEPEPIYLDESRHISMQILERSDDPILCCYCGKDTKENMTIYMSERGEDNMMILPIGKTAHYECYHRAVIRDELKKLEILS